MNELEVLQQEVQQLQLENARLREMVIPENALMSGLAVLSVARQFLDMHEIQSNATWSRPTDSAALSQLMQATGWQPGWPYCAAFVEACWASAAQMIAPAFVSLVRAKFTPSVMQTYRNVRAHVHQGIPAPGAVFFMQKGDSALGHAGIVVLSGPRVMVTIEGNTSEGLVEPGRDREGDGLYTKLRPVACVKSPGLHLLGFLDPPSVSALRKLTITTTSEVTP